MSIHRECDWNKYNFSDFRSYNHLRDATNTHLFGDCTQVMEMEFIDTGLLFWGLPCLSIWLESIRKIVLHEEHSVSVSFIAYSAA